ncbi:MAG: FadR family transcriptional regulator [Thermoflexales bacterium]|nr:FadR family transcriptional regulator [Thermoflexales bacterium]
MTRTVAPAQRPVTEQSLNSAISDRLRDFILSERLRPGDKLPSEGELAEQWQVSRSALREAMRGLEALGVVESRQGSGRQVREFNFDAIQDSLSYGTVFDVRTIAHITEVRKALDAYFIEQAALRVSDEDIVALERMVVEIRRELACGRAYTEVDRRFHRRIFEIAGNPLALQLFTITWEVRMSTVDPQFWKPPESDDEVTIHASIVAALRDRDPAAAREAVLAHYAYSDSVLARARGGASDAGAPRERRQGGGRQNGG